MQGRRKVFFVGEGEWERKIDFKVINKKKTNKTLTKIFLHTTFVIDYIEH